MGRVPVLWSRPSQSNSCSSLSLWVNFKERRDDIIVSFSRPFFYLLPRGGHRPAIPATTWSRLVVAVITSSGSLSPLRDIVNSFCLFCFFFLSVLQSFNNLDYRPDPVVVLGEEHQPHRHRANDNWPRHLDDSQFISSRRYPENHAEVAVDGRYRQQPQQREIGGDARPYASTNLIHQMRDEETIKRPAVVSEEEPQRQMRYFGDTDLESHGGYSTRYQPKAKVLRSASSAAGMGAVRR